MTNDELARQYREAMTCDRTSPDTLGMHAYIDRFGHKNICRIDPGAVPMVGNQPYYELSEQWGRCPLPDPAACDDDEPATKAWIDSLTSEGWPSNERCVPFFLYCGSTVMIAGILAVGPQSTATRGDVRRVAKVFGVELREGK